MKQIVVFASGSGSNFQAIIDAVNSGKIAARITGLIANKPGIKAINRAKDNGIPAKVLKPADFVTSTLYQESLLHTLEAWNPDLIVLAGYLLRIPLAVVEKYQGRIINIHPALLPKYGGRGFFGLNVHRAVINSGDSDSGCTVHFVDEEYDNGSIIAQKIVPVLPVDSPESLAARVLEQEHRLLPEIISKILT